MNKLTADRCKKQIQSWEQMMRISDVAMIVELNLQALEIALPVLEQREMITDNQPVITDNAEMITDSAGLVDGWIEWKGGLVAPVTGMVEVRLRRCRHDRGAEPATGWVWKHRGTGDDIIAYRVVQEQQERDKPDSKTHTGEGE